MKTESHRRRARSIVRRFLLASLIVIVAAAGTYAGTVRGRLDRRDGYGRLYAAAHVGVTLFNSQIGRSSPAYTGGDGMYYLYNVPPGAYYLEIWVYPDREPIRYTIQVNDQPYTDIPPILIP